MTLRDSARRENDLLVLPGCMLLYARQGWRSIGIISIQSALTLKRAPIKLWIVVQTSNSLLEGHSFHV
jgi:hypothetical protein